jgi:hypothetical protein
MPFNVTKYLEESNHIIKLLNKLNERKIETFESDKHQFMDTLTNFKIKLIQIFNDEICNITISNQKNYYSNIPNKIISFGPNRSGANILVNLTETNTRTVWHYLENLTMKSNKVPKYSAINKFLKSIIFGFNLATIKGPICAEPIQGVAFIIERFEANEDLDDLMNNDFANFNLNENHNLVDIDRDLNNSNECVSLEEKSNTELKNNQSSYLKCISFTKEACLKSLLIQNVMFLIIFKKLYLFISIKFFL